jgi:glycerol kinase
MNLRRGKWDDHMLELLRIPPRMLPDIVPSMLAVHELPITELGIPLTGIAGDQQAALFGQAASRPGMAKNTYGTGCFMLMQLGAKPRKSDHRLLTTSACSADPKTPSYALEGSVFVAGAAVQWLRDELGLLEHSAQSEALAASVSDTADCFLVPAFTGLGAPHWDAQARGALIGITRGTRRAHLVRAALESIAYQSAEVLAAMHADAAQPLTELRVDGGASANDWLMQFQADILGVPVNRPRVLESTALGAAQLAGLGCGLFSSTGDCESMREVDRIFEPHMSRDEAAQRMARWAQAVERARGWAHG